jgi:hypothetical protein
MAAKTARTAPAPTPSPARKPQRYRFEPTRIVVVDGTDWPACAGPKPKAKTGTCGKPATVGQRTGAGVAWRCDGCADGKNTVPLAADGA